VDAEWLTATAEKVLEAVEERRSTWQSWHVRAEAQRHVRAAEIAADQVDQLVELLVTEVLHTQSISLTRQDDGITEPGALRRIDGSSVYTVAGSELFTSTRILAAEQRLVAIAGRTERPDPGRRHCRAGAAGGICQREHLRCRTSRPGSCQCGTAAPSPCPPTMSKRLWSSVTPAPCTPLKGVTADTMHGAVTGEESRQQLYTMITRGRAATHLHVSVVGDGNPHAVIQPDSLHLRKQPSCSRRFWGATLN
jgi:hypothetical protein